MSIELKIKAKHLALEPSIICHEEDKIRERIKYLKDKGATTDTLTWKLYSLERHRKWNVCNEARATHLARTYLASQPYAYAEQKRRADREDMFQQQIIPRITTMIQKYGTQDQKKITDKAIQEWSKL